MSTIYKALADYTTQGGAFIAAGTLVRVADPDPSGWWFAAWANASDWLPSSYLAECSAEELKGLGLVEKEDSVGRSMTAEAPSSLSSSALAPIVSSSDGTNLTAIAVASTTSASAVSSSPANVKERNTSSTDPEEGEMVAYKSLEKTLGEIRLNAMDNVDEYHGTAELSGLYKSIYRKMNSSETQPEDQKGLMAEGQRGQDDSLGMNVKIGALSPHPSLVSSNPNPLHGLPATIAAHVVNADASSSDDDDDDDDDGYARAKECASAEEEQSGRTQYGEDGRHIYASLTPSTMEPRRTASNDNDRANDALYPTLFKGPPQAAVAVPTTPPVQAPASILPATTSLIASHLPRAEEMGGPGGRASLSFGPNSRMLASDLLGAPPPPPIRHSISAPFLARSGSNDSAAASQPKCPGALPSMEGDGEHLNSLSLSLLSLFFFHSWPPFLSATFNSLKIHLHRIYIYVYTYTILYISCRSQLFYYQSPFVSMCLGQARTPQGHPLSMVAFAEKPHLRQLAYHPFP